LKENLKGTKVKEALETQIDPTLSADLDKISPEFHCRLEEEIIEVIIKMQRARSRVLPVLEDGKRVGKISASGIDRYLKEKQGLQ